MGYYYVMAEKSTTEDGVYYVVGKTVNEEQATEFIPNADSGKRFVNGAEADSYQLTEIATDMGYHLLKDQIKIDISATDRDIIASVAGVTGMDAAAVEAVVNHYQGGIYDENGNLVTAQRDELTGAMAGGIGIGICQWKNDRKDRSVCRNDSECICKNR